MKPPCRSTYVENRSQPYLARERLHTQIQQSVDQSPTTCRTTRPFRKCQDTNHQSHMHLQSQHHITSTIHTPLNMLPKVVIHPPCSLVYLNATTSPSAASETHRMRTPPSALYHEAFRHNPHDRKGRVTFALPRLTCTWHSLTCTYMHTHTNTQRIHPSTTPGATRLYRCRAAQHRRPSSLSCFRKNNSGGCAESRRGG